MTPMTGLLVVIIPLMLMLFAFAMERIEASLLYTNIPQSTEVKLAKDSLSTESTDMSADHDQQEVSAA